MASNLTTAATLNLRTQSNGGAERGIRAIASAHSNLPIHYPTLNVMHYFKS